MSRALTRSHFRLGTMGAAALVGAAVYWWASAPGQRVYVPGQTQAAISSTAAAGAQEGRQHSTAREQGQGQDATAPPGLAPAVDSEESTIVQYIAEKYQFLLEDLRYLQAGQVEQLNRALLARERLTGEIKAAREADPAAGARLVAQEQALAQAEARIRGLLIPADYATYELLKDSDLELFQLNDYAGGISNVAPLSTADRKSILKTKLAYKERFRQAVRDSPLQRPGLSAAERKYAFEATARALEDFKRNYLQEVRQYLTNDEQYALLSNYETTEFSTELDKLRSMANGG